MLIVNFVLTFYRIFLYNGIIRLLLPIFGNKTNVTELNSFVISKLVMLSLVTTQTY